LFRRWNAGIEEKSKPSISFCRNLHCYASSCKNNLPDPLIVFLLAFSILDGKWPTV